jgi:hypothetical protein
MEEYEKEALLYSFLDYSNSIGETGPKEILKPIIQRGIASLGKTSFTLEEIGIEIEKEFGRRIDLLIIRTELTRIQNIGDLKYDRATKKYIYTNSLEDYKAQYISAKNSSDTFQRELKKYIDSVTDQYNQLTISKVFRYFCLFIQSNMDEFIQMVTKNTKNLNMQYNNNIAKYIERFIFERVLKIKDLFSSFESIFNGLTILYVYENCNSLFIHENTFGIKYFFLDTNIVLRILGLQDTVQNTIGNELKGYLKDDNFTIAITNDTWMEICSLINGYKYNYNRINANGNVSHIYQVMKARNIVPDGVSDFIDDIKDKLLSEGISTEPTINIQLMDFPEIEELTMQLAKRKYENQCELLGEVFIPENNTPDLYIRQADHDLRNIYNIKYLRKGIKNTDFLKEKYYFITADYILKTFIKDKMRHTGQAYAIGDGTLAFLLYYKNPNNTKGFSVQSFLNAHFDSKRLSIKNWYMYYETVKERYKNQQISKEQAGYLLCRVILDNEKFSSSGVENIIDDAIEKYEQQEKTYNFVLTEAEKTKQEKEEFKKLYDEMVKTSTDNISIVSNLERRVEDSSKKNKLLENSLERQSEEIKKQDKKITIIIVLLILFSITLFITDNNILWAITTLFSVFMSITEIINYIKKKNN